MLLGERTGVWSGGGAISARSYIQDGLLVHFNAKENAGYGVYNPSATTWKDLSGNNRDGVFSGDTEWNANGLAIKSKYNNGIVTFNGSHNAIHTVEIVFRCFDALTNYSRTLAENQWLCVGKPNTKQQYYMYGWGIDGSICSGQYSNTYVAQTYTISDDGTKNPEVFNNGTSVGKFVATANNLGNVASTLANRSSLNRGIDAEFYAVRIYNRCLSGDDIAHNAEIDKIIFSTQNSDSFSLYDSPMLTTIEHEELKGCRGLESIHDMTACTKIGYRGVQECLNLTSVGNLISCITLEYNAFAFCTSLVSVGNLPACTSVGAGTFAFCEKLKYIGDLSACTDIGTNAFQNCSLLESISFNSKTHTEVEAITGFANFPDRGQACVFHCSDGDFYRSGSSLLPMPS